MILNAYAVLGAFVLALRALLGLLVVGQASLALAQGGNTESPEGKKVLEDRYYLLFLMAILLLVLNFLSWPLFYLLLQSYVEARVWSGVMCIYGVTQIGTGSINASRFLPALVQSLETTKPLLVFLSGAWFVLYLLNRRTQTGPLLRRVLLVLIVLGSLVLADSVVEAAYLGIPKKEKFLDAGCCTVPFDAEARSSRFLPQAILGERYESGLTAAYFGLNAAMIAVLSWLTYRAGWSPGGVVLGAVAAVALICLAVSGVYLVEVAAPALLRQADHHCPYCLVPRAPESMVAVALLVLGTFSVGWGGVARWFGRCPETEPFLGGVVRQTLRLGLFGYLGSLVMMALELALARS